MIASDSDRERVQTGRPERDPADQPDTDPADQEPEQRADHQLVEHQPAEMQQPLLADLARADQGDQQHGRGIVQTGLGLQSAPQPRSDRDPPQYREHRGRVRRRGNRPDQYGDLPVQPEHEVRDARDHADADRDPDSRQYDAQRHHRTYFVPPGGQTALGQDHHQRREPERMRELRVLEVDVPRTRLAEHQPHAEIDQQRREPEPPRQPDRDHRDQQHPGPGQQDPVELRNVHRGARPPASPEQGPERRKP